MLLFLSAQDISCLEVGLLDSTGRLFSFQSIKTSPEKFLLTISEFLKENKTPLEALQKIVVVSGPGSFTSTRISVTIANALSFAKNIPVIGLENSLKKGGEELITEFGQGWIEQKTEGFVVPFYDRPPHITLKGTGVRG